MNMTWGTFTEKPILKYMHGRARLSENTNLLSEAQATEKVVKICLLLSQQADLPVADI